MTVAGHGFFCDPGRNRTFDPLLRRQLLYPLSYGTRQKNFFCQRKCRAFLKLHNLLHAKWSNIAPGSIGSRLKTFPYLHALHSLNRLKL